MISKATALNKHPIASKNIVKLRQISHGSCFLGSMNHLNLNGINFSSFFSYDKFTNLTRVKVSGPESSFKFFTICAEVKPMQIPPSDMHSCASLLCFILYLWSLFLRKRRNAHLISLLESHGQCKEKLLLQYLVFKCGTQVFKVSWGRWIAIGKHVLQKNWGEKLSWKCSWTLLHFSKFSRSNWKKSSLVCFLIFFFLLFYPLFPSLPPPPFCY